MFSHAELARQFGLPCDALRKRLERWRRRHLTSPAWCEVDARAARQAKYLYRLPYVRHVIDRLVAQRQKPPRPRRA